MQYYTTLKVLVGYYSYILISCTALGVYVRFNTGERIGCQKNYDVTIEF